MLLQHVIRPHRVSGSNRGNDGFVFIEGRRDAIAKSQLHAPVWLEPSMEQLALFSQKFVVARGVDRLMELLVLVVIFISVVLCCRLLASFMRRNEAIHILFRGTPRGKLPRQSLQASHDIEHLDETLRTERRDDSASMWSQFYNARGCELHERFAGDPVRLTGHTWVVTATA